jgi:hypothetical protein
VRHFASLHHFHRKYSVCPSHLQDQQRIDLLLFRLDIHFHHTNSNSALLPQALSPQLQKQNANIPPSRTIPMSLLFSSTSRSTSSSAPTDTNFKSERRQRKRSPQNPQAKNKMINTTPLFLHFRHQQKLNKETMRSLLPIRSFNSMVCLCMVCDVQAALLLHTIDLAA